NGKGREVMPEASREHILATIRNSLGSAPRPAAVSLPGARSSSREVMAACERDRAELLEQFSCEFTKVRGHVHLASDHKSISECLLAIASKYSARRLVSWRAGECESWDPGGILQRAGITVVEDVDGLKSGEFVREAANAD